MYFFLIQKETLNMQNAYAHIMSGHFSLSINRYKPERGTLAATRAGAAECPFCSALCHTKCPAHRERGHCAG